MSTCECGCGKGLAETLYKGRLRRFVHGHQNRRPLRERLLEKVTVDHATGCWVWGGSVNVNGYGYIGVGSTTEGTRGNDSVHRVSFRLHVGPIPAGLELDHLCRNRACCNPAHLEAVTPRENKLRGVSPAAERARATHCHRGHEFTRENTRIYQGTRQCRKCGVINTRIYRARKAAA